MQAPIGNARVPRIRKLAGRADRVDVREPGIAEATRDSPRISTAYILSRRLAARHALLGIFINRIISSVAPLPG